MYVSQAITIEKDDYINERDLEMSPLRGIKLL